MISVIIPSYKRPHIISGTLLYLATQTVFKTNKFEILVSIDNKDPSKNDYQNLIEQINKIYQVLFNVKPIKILINNSKGLVAAKNKAVIESKYKYLMMMDDDLYPQSNYMEELIKDLEHNNKVGAVSGYIVSYKPAISHTQPSDLIKKIPEKINLQTLNTSYNSNNSWKAVFGKKEQVMDWRLINKNIPSTERFKMDYFVNSYMVRRTCILEAKLFNINLNSKTSPHEEVDLTYRIRKLGYDLIFNPHIRMWHLTVGSGGIYKGKDINESKDILNKEYNKSLNEFFKSIR
jgi:GT2 family glycosyltransferase